MTQDTANAHRGEAAGILYAGSAYAFWGITPLYWRLLGNVPPFQLTTHRVLWCALFVAIVTAWRGRLGHIVTILRTPRLLGTLALTSILISTNWTIYIYCVATNQLVEASLGYYLTPLLSIALGVFLFGEHMTRWRLAGVILAAVAVGIKTVALGHVPWIAFSLALSFGFYGYFRKKAPVDSMDGLLIETVLLLPFTLTLVTYWASTEPAAFPRAGLLTDALLMAGGPITAVPLAMFAEGARRIRMTTLGFLQYFTPTITLLLATLGFHEHFGRIDAISFAFVWVALLIVALEGRFRPALAAQVGG
ncbi:MAG TPA: EamA family transporter RarD [Rhizomicrobium sp.]|nr:EamA family transporter RarD [Rhizomicrobium sp.]